MKKEKTVSLCMIVKNEEKYLKQCLSSIKDVVDEMIIVDTGSTDSTISIAESFGAKIFYYEWDNDFSHARNFSLSKATCDWILLLDADEVLERNDQDKLITFINTSPLEGCHFTVYNYIGATAYTDFTIHYAFRLLKNNGYYEFKGAIHEQISSIQDVSLPSHFATENIILHHYGYLDSVVNQKNKRARNIPILMKQLESEPHNPFYLFNLGNEYLADHNLLKAVSTYELAHHYITIAQPFIPHLFHRMIMCLSELKSYERAIDLANEALATYPSCTDIEYCKGMAFYSWHKYTLAIESFNKCLQMGEPPNTLKFVNDCGTYRPYIVLGEIYMTLRDYDNAIAHFTKAINFNGSLYSVLYQLGEALNKRYKDKHEVALKLAGYFSSLDYLPNLIVYMDIIIRQQLYLIAQEQIVHMNTMEGNPVDKQFITSKLNFFNQKYDLAYEGFKEILNLKTSSTLLPEVRKESLSFLFVISILDQQTDFTIIFQTLKDLNDAHLEKVYLELHAIYTASDVQYLTDSDDPTICLPFIMNFLDKLLKIQEFDLFEKYLYILNKINSKNVLLYLAKLAYQNNFKEMALQTIFKSIKELDSIDHECIDILSHEI